MPEEIAHDDNKMGLLGSLYSSILHASLKMRYLVVAAALGLFALSAWHMSVNMGRELFPQVDSSQVTIYIRLKSGTRIEETEKKIIEIEKEIVSIIGKPDVNNEIPESDLQFLVSNIGVLLDWPAAYTPNAGAMDAFVLIQTKGQGPNIFEYVDQLRTRLEGKFEGVEFSFDTGGMLTAALNMGEPAPIHFQIQSSQLETGQAIARKIVEVANRVNGTSDARIAQRLDNPTLEVTIDREKAMEFGLTVDEVMKSLISVTNSSINFEPAFWVDKRKGNHYFLGVQYPEELLGVEMLKEVPVGGSRGSVRLGDVVSFDRGEGPPVINHRNISRVTDVYVNVINGFDVGGVCSQIEAELVDLGAEKSTDERGEIYRLGGVTKDDIANGSAPADSWTTKPFSNGDAYKGRTFRMMGEVRTMRESFAQFGQGLALATVLVYLVMVALFQSFIDPLIVMLAVPLGFIGVVAALVITGTNLSIMSFMGIVMMVGIVVEYSIVLVDFANKLVEEGKSPYDAVVEASKVRLRPILMTSTTTWLAMLPMAIGFGGSEANVPLARAIIGGVIGATILTLVVVPCLYVIIKGFRSPSSRPSSDPARRDESDNLKAAPTVASDVPL